MGKLEVGDPLRNTARSLWQHLSRKKNEADQGSVASSQRPEAESSRRQDTIHQKRQPLSKRHPSDQSQSQSPKKNTNTDVEPVHPPNQSQRVKQMVTQRAERDHETQSDTGRETQSQIGDQRENKTADEAQNEKGNEPVSRMTDQVRSKMVDQNQIQMADQTQGGTETNTQITNQDQIRECDQTETEDHPPTEEHEISEGGSSLVEVEASGSKLVTTSLRRGIMSLLSRTPLTRRIRFQGGGSSNQQPGPEQELQAEKSLGLMSIEDFNEDDIIIAVMGPTGSGKSTFVHSVSGCETARVGNELKSCTSDVRAVRFREQESGRFVVLVDTPGFDDTYKSDFDILSMISDWLTSSYKRDKLLSGILYLHRITDNRVAGTSLKNLGVFRMLCGDDALEKVYFTTTMWDEVTEEVGKRRLKELKSVYWNKMIGNGAKVFRCVDTVSSPKELVRMIVEDDGGGRGVLLQEEMVELEKEIKETAAGRELYSNLEAIVQKQTEFIRRINGARVGAKDPKLALELEGQLAELRKQMDEKLREMEKLKLPRMSRFFFKIRDSPKMLRFLISQA